MDWFRVQHYDTVARNLASLSVLRSLLALLFQAEIPALIFKGPALAALGSEMARSWNDLDILVERTVVERVEQLLSEVGYRVLPGPRHPNHRRYAFDRDIRQAVLEVHFDISDPLRAYRPDVAGIWARSTEAQVLGVQARVPELSDHLLLTIMQLPHHHWSVRLLLDVWQVILRQQATLNWETLFGRAEEWRMTALTRSTFAVLDRAFGVSFPDHVRARVRPVGYYDRLRREIACQSVNEQFEYPFRPKVMWIAPFVMTERPGRVLRILLRRLLAGEELMEGGRVETAVRRNLKSVEVLPAVARAFATSLFSGPG